jgi:septal ring factor EnvC (AmiA/AmiB activator)
MTPRPKKIHNSVERLAEQFTNWVGSPASLVLHTIVFAASFVLVLFGAALDKVLLVLTTAVSLEAIYLAIFIQMSVNRASQSLAVVEEDIGEIQEDVEEIERDVDEIQKDVDEIQEDVEEIERDVDEIQKDVDEIQEDVEEIEQDVDKLEAEEQKENARDAAQDKSLDAIQDTLHKLLVDLEALKSAQRK